MGRRRKHGPDGPLMHELPRSERYPLGSPEREAQNACTRRYRRKHKAKVLASNKKWLACNPERRKEYSRRQHQKNPARFREKAAAYRARCRGESDPRVRAMYVACTWLRKLGDNVSVDHIIPLVRGGLHIFWNLRIIPRGANCKKHARPATEDELEICRLWLETESAF